MTTTIHDDIDDDDDDGDYDDTDHDDDNNEDYDSCIRDFARLTTKTLP